MKESARDFPRRRMRTLVRAGGGSVRPCALKPLKLEYGSGDLHTALHQLECSDKRYQVTTHR